MNFHDVLHDLLAVFSKYAEPRGGNYWTRKFYKESKPGSDSERDALKQYQRHVNMVEDLTLELTRAANLVCDRVRKCFDSSFLTEHGKLFVVSGLHEDFRDHAYFVKYQEPEVNATRPYPGLALFSEQRKKRDLYLGDRDE